MLSNKEGASASALPVSDGKLHPKPAAQVRRTALRYIAGNGGSLLAGLILARLVLTSMRIPATALVSIKASDFVAYFGAARLVLEGHGAHMYAATTLGHLESTLIHPFVLPSGVLPYVYPPYFALGLAPLGALSYSAAYMVWLAVDCLLLAGTMFLLESCAGLSGRRALVCRFLALGFVPVVAALLEAQSTLLLLALFSAAFAALVAGRQALGGVALAVALVKPQYLLPFLVVLLVRRQWRALAAFAATALCLVAVPMVFFGASINSGYLQWLRDAVNHHGWYAYFNPPQDNQTLAGIAQLLFPSPAAAIVRLATVALALALLVHCALRSPDIDLPLGLAGVVGLLISPHVFSYDLALLLPIAVVLRYRGGGRMLVPSLVGGAYLVITVGSSIPHAAPVQLSVLAMAALSLWFVVSARGHGSSRPLIQSRPEPSLVTDS
jgi:hypothetical protein